MEYKTEAKLKEAGKIRLEGKEYHPKDGDIMFFRFNVLKFDKFNDSIDEQPANIPSIYSTFEVLK